MKAVELTSRQFGRLTVLKRAGSSKNRNATWACQCECGATTIVPGSHLQTGNTTSCGCYHREQQSKRVAERNARQTITYGGAHDRVIRVRGSALLHACVDCGSTADEWSYSHRDPVQITDSRGRAFSLDPAYYEPRCRPCHRTFDANRSSSSAPAA